MMVSTLEISRIFLNAGDMEELRKGAVLPVKLPGDALVEILCTGDACGQGGGGGGSEISVAGRQKKYLGKGEVEKLLEKTMEAHQETKAMKVGDLVEKLRDDNVARGWSWHTCGFTSKVRRAMRR